MSDNDDAVAWAVVIGTMVLSGLMVYGLLKVAEGLGNVAAGAGEMPWWGWLVVVGVAVVVVIVLLLLVGGSQEATREREEEWEREKAQERQKKKRQERRAAEETRRKEEEKAKRKEEERREEERQQRAQELEAKREELRHLQLEAEGKRRLLQLSYAKRYAFKHREVIEKEWGERLADHRKRLRDPDFLVLVKELEAEEMLAVWEREQEIKDFVDVMDEADVQKYEARRLIDFKEAVEEGRWGEGIALGGSNGHL